MTSSPHITIGSLFFVLSLKNVLGAINLTDLVISDYDFTDPDNDRVVHVNANDFFEDSVMNQTLSRPELSVTVDYETPAGRAKAEEDEDNYEAEVEEQFLSLDSYNIHLPKFHPQMTDIEFSDWYFLFLSPTENRTDVGEITGPREKLPTPSSSVSDEVTRSLSEKLRVPVSQFRVGSLEQYRSGSLSVNLSLTSHKLPGLHKRLCSLPHSAPSFSLMTVGPGGQPRQFHLVQVFHDKNQHLYINNNMDSLSTMESLGLLITLTLGGLGMFLVVLVVTFVLAKVVTKPPEFERFSEFGESSLADSDNDCTEPMMYSNIERKDIFVIEDVEGCILTPHKIEEPMEKFEDMQPRRLQRLTKLWSSLTSGRLKDNLFGSKFIELKP